ncbi:uncharacterized protein LOC108599217 [Drosophila busckii]|nr:uncharacterized protein LOC108599217 [Drosophila busckii]
MAALPERFVTGRRQFWREFLKLYQQMPQLWDLNHDDYKNKELKDESYELLREKLREIQPNATRSDVSRRINIFRTNYRREQMRLWKQKESGKNPKSCKPTLWFYDNMSFLLTQASFRKRLCAKLERSTKNNHTPPPTDSWLMHSHIEAAPVTVTQDLGLLSPKIEIFENEIAAEPASCSTDTNMTVIKESKSPDNIISEASEALAKSWAIQYEEMRPTQRILARKAIADILFEGCMGNLRINRGERSSVAHST